MELEVVLTLTLQQEALKLNDVISRRHGYAGHAAPITVREDAPADFRAAIVQIAAEEGFGLPSAQRQVICRVLRVLPDGNNWSEHPNIADEVECLIGSCPWYRVYDIAEAVYQDILKQQSEANAYGRRQDTGDAAAFEAKLNEVLFEKGIGWKMERGLIVYRGDQPFEQAVAGARQQLASSGRMTAEQEVAEALRDLSRRPNPDRTGAIQHSMAALECLVRDVCGNPQPTLGALMAKYRTTIAIPPPLDIAIEKTWGYASEVGRHLREGREPSAEEAELVATMCAAMVTYLVKKHRP